VRTDLPRGRVTLLFTDVEGSTRLLHRLGAERYAEALAAHRTVVREAAASRGGVEVDTQGDAFFIAFSSAPGAVEAADSIARGLEDGPIKVRMGLHTGTPLVTDEGYVGADVHRAARIAAAGHGGQILISAATAPLLGGASLRDLGEHRLKDLSAAERLFQLGEGEFPRLRTLYQTNLPIPATPFVGRGEEVGEVVGLLERDDVRLLTLAGAGGTGKTRLALQAAAGATERFPDGLWWVPLAPLRDASLFAATLASILGLAGEPGESPVGSLAAAIEGKKLLVLLDNAEHLLPAIREDLATLRSTNGPTILVTSRERLQLQGEHVWNVPSLRSEDGLALFTERARSLDSTFVATPTVEELCARLENLPLALELAAARSTLFTPAQLLERLSQRLDLLKGSSDLHSRQQTLRATIEWSHDLLQGEEPVLFARLSVFAGGCIYEAAEEVCGADPDTLQSLIDKSLVGRRTTEQDPRYWMLETVREFAAGRLAELLSTDETRRRHARWCLGFARRHLGAHGHAELHRLELELANMRLARTYLREQGDVDAELELVGSLRTLWDIHGHRLEGLQAIEEALARADGADTRVQALAWQALATVAFVTDLERKRYAAQRSVELYRSLGDRLGLADSLVMLGIAALEAEDHDAAEAVFDEARRVSRELGYARGEAAAVLNLGLVALIEGDPERSAPLSEHALTIFRELDDDFGIVVSLENLAIADLQVGRLVAAYEHAAASLTAARVLESRPAVVYGLEVLAAVLAESSKPLEAARLLGAAEAIRESIQEGARETVEARIYEAAASRVRDDLGPGRLAEEWARGAALSLEEAADYALAAVPG
jgi:predicted ATPase/class 3 adenylate cyclase